MRVLLVEDEPLVAMFAADALERAGCEVVGPAATVAEALRLLDAGGADAALVDLRLGRGESGLPVAEALAARDIPFAFASGYGAESLPEGMRDRPLLVKPYGAEAVARVLRALGAGGAADRVTTRDGCSAAG